MIASDTSCAGINLKYKLLQHLILGHTLGNFDPQYGLLVHLLKPVALPVPLESHSEVLVPSYIRIVSYSNCTILFILRATNGLSSICTGKYDLTK